MLACLQEESLTILGIWRSQQLVLASARCFARCAAETWKCCGNHGECKNVSLHHFWNVTFSVFGCVRSAAEHSWHKQVALSQLQSINHADSNLVPQSGPGVWVSHQAKEGFPLKAAQVASGWHFFFPPSICVKRAVRHHGCEWHCNYLIHTWSPYRLDKGQCAEACECRAAQCMYCKYDSPPLNPNSCWWIPNNVFSVRKSFKSIQISSTNKKKNRQSGIVRAVQLLWDHDVSRSFRSSHKSTSDLHADGQWNETVQLPASKLSSSRSLKQTCTFVLVCQLVCLWCH